MTTTNLFTDLPNQLPAELFTTLLQATNVRIERIVSHGHASPVGYWYDQDEAEWVIVLKGAARIRFEDVDEPFEMTPGDFVNIPPIVGTESSGRRRTSRRFSWQFITGSVDERNLR